MELRIKDVLKEKDVQQKELAERMDVSSEALSRIIGNKGNPTLSTLEKIAAALGVSVIDLFEADRGDFTALIDHGGKLYRFDSIDALKGFIWGQIME